ncbi:MAG: o-succinylbenzoate--CoA ligase [Candidatus Promineifilaceae bacterium]
MFDHNHVWQDWLAARAAASPQKLALIFGKEQWKYGELNTAVSHLTAHLYQQGICPGDFVAVLLPNSPLYVCLVHALARLGAVLVPLNTRLTPAELQWQIDHVAAKWLVTAEKNSEIMNCEQLIMTDKWLQGDAPFPIPHSPFTTHNLQAIVFTSGTSGRPKGAMLTFANHFYSAMASAYRLGVLPYDRWLSVLPLYHVGGLAVVFRSCLYGTAVILHPRFQLDTINASLDHDTPTLISVVPTMLYRLLQSRSHWPASLRLILLGGAAATPELVARANGLPRAMDSDQYSVFSGQQKLNTDNRLLNTALIAPTYGLTEAASQVATMPPEEAVYKPGSVGKPLLFTSVKIVGEDGASLPPGEIGEIVVTGPTVMAGYWQQPTVNSQQLTVNGLRMTDDGLPNALHTGDLGYLDDEGDLWVVQRRSDLIVSGGENVYPAEVEEVLRGHTAVLEACVVGVPHPEWGQQVAAMVQLQPGQVVTEDELLAFSRERLAGYKQPRLLRFVAELPRTASGKIARQQVAEMMADG